MPVTIVTRSGKGSPLTWNELDANFNNLNTGIDTVSSTASSTSTTVSNLQTTVSGLQTSVTTLNNNAISYETGTFTPVIIGVTTAGTGTYTSQEGKYTKIGNVVNFTVYLIWTAHTGTGSMRITGLPFQPTSALVPCSTYYRNLLVASGKQLTMFIPAGNTYIRLIASDPAGGDHADIAIDTAGSLAIAGSYITS